MKKRTALFVVILSVLSVSFLGAAEVPAERMAAAVLANLAQGDCGTFRFVEDNWQSLEKVIFDLAPREPRFFGARSNALNYLAILCRNGKIPQEVFFDIGCRAIKNCVFSSTEPADLKTEIGAYRQIIGGFGFFAGWEQLPLLRNLKAFFVFLQAMKKHGLLLSLNDFNSINKSLIEIQDFLEENKVEGKNRALHILKNLAAEISTCSKEAMDPNARSVTLQYIEGLITQTTKQNVE